MSSRSDSSRRDSREIVPPRKGWRCIFRPRALGTLLVALLILSRHHVAAVAGPLSPEVEQIVDQGLAWLSHQQLESGGWMTQQRYPTAMTGLAGLALLCEGSTTTQGRYAENLRRAVSFLTRRSRDNGLIGDEDDDRYTYGHGFAMLFLSQVLGEEEDADRRSELLRVLSKAVEFTGRAQTRAGGWGYVSALDQDGFDEGSTTITQVQGLRGCRNAGVPVPKEIIDAAVKYIHACTQKEGGVQYSSKGGGPRPAITAAAIACLYNAGEYDDTYVPRMLEYCRPRLQPSSQDTFGHWHYAHFYYSQVQYREGGDVWEKYRQALERRLSKEATELNIGGDQTVYWQQGYIGPVYTTALNLIMLQLERSYLPIYQR